jgi:glycosyltransferase involved in cell wall biosynthesis
VKTLLTIGHSYAVGHNRVLAHEIARQGADRWKVTIAAPERIDGEMHPVALAVLPDEPCEVVPLTMRINWQPHLRFFSGLRGLLRRDWDLIHIWQEPYVVAAAQIALVAPKAARVVPATFQNISKRYPAPVRYVERQVMCRADGWIAFGRTARDAQMSKAIYDARPVRVIPPGVDVGRFRPDADSRAEVRRQLGWSSSERVIGFLGRFVPEKGLDILTRALSIQPGRWCALFVGAGPMEGALRRFERRFPNRVRILTKVQHSAVPAHLNAMDMLCAPSLTTSAWREQFGRMLIEAMACGVPIVASRSGEIPHVVEDAGLLVDEDDEAGLAAAIAALLRDDDLRHRLARRALARVRERFSWPVVARAHLAFFDELLGSCPG